MDTVKWEDSDAPRWTSDIATVGAVAITSAQPALEANQHGHREIRWSKHFKAYCVCGRKMLPTTPDDVRAGVQPRCPRCPS